MFRASEDTVCPKEESGGGFLHCQLLRTDVAYRAWEESSSDCSWPSLDDGQSTKRDAQETVKLNPLETCPKNKPSVRQRCTNKSTEPSAVTESDLHITRLFEPLSALSELLHHNNIHNCWH